MTLEGSVTNVTNFGAFVDVGVHQDGLVHISQMADRFVSDPNEIVQVGQVVTVRVMEVDTKLKRIGLSMRLDGEAAPKSAAPSTHQAAPTASPPAVKTKSSPVSKPPRKAATGQSLPADKAFNPEDLKQRFNRRRP